MSVYPQTFAAVVSNDEKTGEIAPVLCGMSFPVEKNIQAQLNFMKKIGTTHVVSLIDACKGNADVNRIKSMCDLKGIKHECIEWPNYGYAPGAYFEAHKIADNIRSESSVRYAVHCGGGGG